MKPKVQCYLAAILLSLPLAGISVEAHAGPPVQTNDAVSERIYFVQPDGRHAMVYTTSRSDYTNYNLWFNEQDGYEPDDYLKNFLYLFPNSGTWANEKKDGHMILKLPQGNFASLRWIDLKEKGRLQIDENNVHVYRSWDAVNEAKTSDGHFGMWNSPGDFRQVAWSWVFPESMEPLTYTSNRPGEWVKRHNTLTYYGHDVNDLIFDLQYRPKLNPAYQDLKDLEGEGVEVEQQATGIKMTLAETLLFPSGVATISVEGKKLLDKLAESLKSRSTLNIVVAGHTDNIRISKALSKTYPTNWELSSARSISIIHYLVGKGVAEPRFQAQAFSYMRPIASNDSQAGRSKNRRIEILLTEESEAPAPSLGSR